MSECRVVNSHYYMFHCFWELLNSTDWFAMWSELSGKTKPSKFSLIKLFFLCKPKVNVNSCGQFHGAGKTESIFCPYFSSAYTTTGQLYRYCQYVSGFRENIAYSQTLASTFMLLRNLMNKSANIFHTCTFKKSMGLVKKGNKYIVHILIWILGSIWLARNCRAKAARMKIRIKR